LDHRRGKRLQMVKQRNEKQNDHGKKEKRGTFLGGPGGLLRGTNATDMKELVAQSAGQHRNEVLWCGLRLQEDNKNQESGLQHKKRARKYLR